MQMAQPHFLRIHPKNDRMSSPLKRNKAQTTHVFGFVPWKLAIFLICVVLGLESEPLRELSMATGDRRDGGRMEDYKGYHILHMSVYQG